MPEYDPEFDFRGNADRLLLAFRLIADSVDVEQMLVVGEYADTLDPFVDPTKYMQALERGDMHDLLALCRALHEPLKVWADRIAPKIPVNG